MTSKKISKTNPKSDPTVHDHPNAGGHVTISRHGYMGAVSVQTL
jgi:hypothetical protein